MPTGFPKRPSDGEGGRIDPFVSVSRCHPQHYELPLSIAARTPNEPQTCGRWRGGQGGEDRPQSPHTCRATSVTRRSFRSWVAKEMLFPFATEAKPHCGLRA